MANEKEKGMFNLAPIEMYLLFSSTNWNWLERHYQHNSGGNNGNCLHNADKGKCLFGKSVLLILSIGEIQCESREYQNNQK